MNSTKASWFQDAFEFYGTWEGPCASLVQEGTFPQIRDALAGMVVVVLPQFWMVSGYMG